MSPFLASMLAALLLATAAVLIGDTPRAGRGFGFSGEVGAKGPAAGAPAWGPRSKPRTRASAPDPVPDDIAAEALGQAVALLQAGVTGTHLFKVWGRTRAYAATTTGTASTDSDTGNVSRGDLLGASGEPSVLSPKGRLRVRQGQLRTHWLRAIAAADLQLSSGGDLKQVDGPGQAWNETMWAIDLSTSTGAPLADLLSRVRDECNARADAARARIAGMAAARTTRRILMSLPAAGLLLAQALGAEPIQVLFGSRWGRISLIIGGLFWIAAAVWSRLIMRSGPRQATPARGAS